MRVVIVDDAAGLRVVFRRQLERDARFDVIGEGADGREAVALAERLQPDLMILDEQMPVMTGLAALPEIRRASPRTVVVVYTAHRTPGTYEAAITGGAIDVLDKSAGGRLIERIVATLVHRASDADATIEVRVGPVASSAAKVWVRNTATILAAMRRRPDALDAPVPIDVLDTFGGLLDEWAAVAESSEEFMWVARARPREVRRIVEHWAPTNEWSDEQLARLGVAYSPPEGEPFWRALVSGMIDALAADEGLRHLAQVLEHQRDSAI